MQAKHYLPNPYGPMPTDPVENHRWRQRWEQVGTQYQRVAEATSFDQLRKATETYCLIMDMWYDTYAEKPRATKGDRRRGA